MKTSDTPRTDAAYSASTGAGIYELFRAAQDLERELEQAKEDRARAAMDARNPLLARIAELDGENKALRDRVEELERLLRSSMRALREKVEGGGQ